MEDSFYALLRIEGANSCPGKGWDQILDSDSWVWELPGSPDLKQAVFDALSPLDLGGSRVVLHLALFGKDRIEPVWLDHELLAFLASKGGNIELYN